MELTNEFKVGVPVQQAWSILTDLERIAPCMPGAQLQEVEGDEYRGIVKVKVGPITAQYRGAASFQELDADGHRAVLRAEGRETRGQGNAAATITATLAGAGDGTTVKLVTDLTITGRVAQFGRGVLADVSAKLLGQFVERLEADVLSGSGSDTVDLSSTGTVASEGPPSGNGRRAAGASGEAGATTEIPSGVATATTTAPGTDPTGGAMPATGTATGEPDSRVRRIDSPEARPVDLLDTAGAPLAKRALPLLAVVVVLLLWRRSRRRRRR